MASLHPSHGARVVLEREPAERGARYRVHVYEPEVVHAGLAELSPSGTLTWGPWSSSPPGWALLFTERLLRGLPKKHAADESWPRKLVRWRDER